MLRFNQKYRKECLRSLLIAGYENPQIFFERNRKDYTSYWGSQERRMEVVYFKETGETHIYELKFL